MIGNSMLYPLIAAVTVVAFMAIVPKEKYKHYLLWGLVFGGLGDAAVVGLLVPLKLIEYRNMGPFNILGLFSFFTPITWAFVFSLFFFLMPIRKPWLVLYVVTFVGANYAHGLMMEQLNLFRYIGIQRFLAIPIFLVWYGVSALVYRKYGQEKKRASEEVKSTGNTKVVYVRPPHKLASLPQKAVRFVRPKKIK